MNIFRCGNFIVENHKKIINKKERLVEDENMTVSIAQNLNAV